MNIEQIAKVCHETNSTFCRTIGDNSQKPWEDAEDWQRESAVKGVAFAISNPQAPASSQHEAWVASKIADGWKYGPVKDPVLKTHPCIVDYGDLPVEQRLKDYLFKAVVSAFLLAECEHAAN